MKRIKILFLTVTGLILSISSCFDEAFDLFPHNSVADEVLFSTESGAEAALIGCYDPVTPGYYMFSAFGMEYYGDTTGTGVESGPASSDAQALSQKIVTPANRFAQRWYYETYRHISCSNNFLYFVEDTPFKDPNRKKVAKGEAMFIRAMSYFRLAILYGTVPLVVDVPPELYPERASETDLYAQIIEDLEYGISNLPDRNEGVLRPGFYEARATRGAAKGLLAKILMTAPEPLYDLDRAIQLTGEIINSGLYELLPNYEDLWMVDDKNNKESIFLISLANYPQEGSNAASLSVPEQIWFRPTWGFYNSFNDTDSRKKVSFHHLLITIPPPPAPALDTIRNELYLGKLRYDPRAQVAWVQDCFPMYFLRLADIILLRAEALAVKDLNGNMTEILSLMNQIRNRAYKGADPDPYVAADFPDLHEFKIKLWWERRKELFFEIQSFYDAKRLGLGQEILGLQDYQLVFPFGFDALIDNPNLKQNPGY